MRNREWGSTDVGDVSWCIPTAQINTSTFPAQAPGHSWQNVSCGRTSIAHKNMLLAGKVIAATAIDLMEKPDVLQAAKDEFNKKMKRYGGYTCPVPQAQFRSSRVRRCKRRHGGVSERKRIE